MAFRFPDNPEHPDPWSLPPCPKCGQEPRTLELCVNLGTDGHLRGWPFVFVGSGIATQRRRE